MVLLFIGSVQSCHEDETSNESNQPITTSYNATILSYLANLKSAAGKENGTKIEAIKEAINLNTIHIYNLKSTEKLLIADISTLKGFESYNATKVIFFILNNNIIRSNIVTIKNKVPFDNVNQVLISIFDRKENKDNYSGKIEFYNLFKNILLSDEFENGKLTVNGVRRRSPNSSLTTKSNGCVAWYWVTTYFDGTQTKEYMYTTCDCEEQTYRGDCGGGASSGGGSSSTNNNSAGPNYPDNPNDKDLYTYIDYDGEIVTRQYDMKSNSWIIVSIKLPDVVVNNNPEKYSFLLFAWPSDRQKILKDSILYTYDAASGNWNGEPETDPCTDLKNQITGVSIDDEYKFAVSRIKTVSSDGFEHSITLGKDSNGKITQAPMNNGTSQYLVKTNTTYAGAFAAIHNHPNGTPMSAGDVYAAVKLNTLRPDFTTTFLVLPDGSMYALVVTDLEAAKAFVTNYPADVIGNNSPEFPNFIFDQIVAIQTSDMTYTSIEGKTKAISIILDKYNSGITLLKQDSDGNFNPIKMEEIVQNGNTIYTPKPCN